MWYPMCYGTFSSLSVARTEILSIATERLFVAPVSRTAWEVAGGPYRAREGCSRGPLRASAVHTDPFNASGNTQPQV